MRAHLHRIEIRISYRGLESSIAPDGTGKAVGSDKMRAEGAAQEVRSNV
jgi:hypothetical protein